jgi:hypothetical protein
MNMSELGEFCFNLCATGQMRELGKEFGAGFAEGMTPQLSESPATDSTPADVIAADSTPIGDWQNEVSGFGVQEGEQDTWDIIVVFRGGGCAHLASLTPEQERIVSHTLAILKQPGPRAEMEQLAVALTRKINAHHIAPEGMAFPVGLYAQPVPRELAHIWHNADGTTGAPDSTAPAEPTQHACACCGNIAAEPTWRDGLQAFYCDACFCHAWTRGTTPAEPSLREQIDVVACANMTATGLRMLDAAMDAPPDQREQAVLDSLRGAK